MPTFNASSVIAIIAKAIKKKHGDITQDITDLDSAYKAASEAFEESRERIENAFRLKYAIDDTDFQGDEQDALEAAEQSIIDKYNAIINSSDDIINSLVEFNTQIELEKGALEADKTQKANALENSRAEILTKWGLMSEYQASFENQYNLLTVLTNRYCFHFDGMSNSVAVSSPFVYNLKEAFTLSAWIAVDEDFLTEKTQTAGDVRFREYGIIDKAEQNAREGYHFGLRRTIGPNFNVVKLAVSVGRNGTAGPADRRVEFRVNTPGNSVFTPGLPHHVVATFNREDIYFNNGVPSPKGVAKLYIDGVKVAEGPIDGVGNIVRADERFCIGNTTADPGKQEFKGMIDEVSVWNIPLSDAQVSELSDWTSNGNLNSYASRKYLSANLLGWYRMGDISDSFDPNVRHLDEDGTPLMTSFDIDGNSTDPNHPTFNGNTGLPIDGGSWTLKSSTDVSDETKYLSTIGVSEINRVSPGIINSSVLQLGEISVKARNLVNNLVHLCHDEQIPGFGPIIPDENGMITITNPDGTITLLPTPAGVAGEAAVDEMMIIAHYTENEDGERVADRIVDLMQNTFERDGVNEDVIEVAQAAQANFVTEFEDVIREAIPEMDQEFPDRTRIVEVEDVLDLRGKAERINPENTAFVYEEANQIIPIVQEMEQGIIGRDTVLRIDNICHHNPYSEFTDAALLEALNNVNNTRDAALIEAELNSRRGLFVDGVVQEKGIQGVEPHYVLTRTEG